jgi:ornithine cyclodeaminase/alanine dehydrogenase-like protein (mu-crystallin family)
MALLLTESDVARLLGMEETIAAVQSAFMARGRGEAVNRPRNRIPLPQWTLHVMSAALPSSGLIGLKAYLTGADRARFVVLAWSTATGALEAVIEADRLGQVRTGAATGVATNYMARPDAQTVGCLGTGWQAQSQLEAVCAVRPTRQVSVYSRDRGRRTAFAKTMADRLRVPVDPTSSAEEAVRWAEIIITATTAREPVLFGRWLSPGMHINAVGVNWASKRELDEEAVRRAARIVVDDREQAAIECGDLQPLVAAGALSWARVHELGDVVAGKIPGRATPDEITLFESQGLAIEDLAAAAVLIGRARAAGVGQEIPIGG